MRQRIASSVAAFGLTVIAPSLVMAMVHVNPAYGWPLVGVCVLTSIGILLWGFTLHSTRTWRGKMWPIIIMSAGFILYAIGALWYYRAHEVRDYRPDLINGETADQPVAALPRTTLPSVTVPNATTDATEPKSTFIPPQSTAAQLPLSITQVSEPSYQRYSGLRYQIERQGSVDSIDPPMLVVPQFFISNTSTSRAVTLEITLVIHNADGTIRKMKGDGEDGTGHRLGRTDLVTKTLQRNDIDPNRFILSPVTIAPQATIHGSIPFVEKMFGWDAKSDQELIKTLVTGNLGFSDEGMTRKSSYELELLDVISKKQVTIKLPSPGFP